MEPLKCFLVEPVYGETLPLEPVTKVGGYNCYNVGWPPYRSITGWRRADDGLYHPDLMMFGAGAMWFAPWIPKQYQWDNETEPHLVVRCPNGDHNTDWDIDSRCNNCALPHDRLHRCWVRHGSPPNITVDKDGASCKAGAGSIRLGDWHGYLRNGMLVDA